MSSPIKPKVLQHRFSPRRPPALHQNYEELNAVIAKTTRSVLARVQQCRPGSDSDEIPDEIPDEVPDSGLQLPPCFLTESASGLFGRSHKVPSKRNVKQFMKLSASYGFSRWTVPPS